MGAPALLTGCRAGELLALRAGDFESRSQTLLIADSKSGKPRRSHLTQQGVPLLFIAAALGHRDARMVEKHYGHLAPSHVADTIRAALPSFGGAPVSNVQELRPHARQRLSTT